MKFRENVSLLLCVLVQLVPVIKADYDPSKCKIASGANSTRAPPTFDDNFYMFIENKAWSSATALNPTISATNMQIYFSQNDGRAYVHQTYKGNTTDTWVEAKVDQILNSIDSKSVPSADLCKGSSLQGSDIGSLLNVQAINDSSMALGTPSQVLQFSLNIHAKTSQGPQGYYDDRGIYVDVWQTCNYFPAHDATATMTWYFNDNAKMLMPTTNNEVPIFVEVDGVAGNGMTFKSRIDYASQTYNVDTKTDKAFQPPSNLYCVHAIVTQSLPKIPNYFRYKGEQVTSYINSGGQVALNIFEETYLSPLKLFVRDSESTPVPGSTNGVSFYRTVSDFNTGLQYTANLKSGTCSITPIPKWNNAAFSIANGKVVMRTSSQFFDLDSQGYEFMGVHDMPSRGIQSNSYTTFFPSTDANGRGNSLYTWNFATPDFLRALNYRTPYNDIPVSVKVENPEAIYTMNFFEYSTQLDRPIPDVSSCFNSSQATPIEMYFTGRFDQIVTPDPYGFQSTFLLNVMGAMGILSPIRVAKIDVQPANNNQIVVRFLLLEKPNQAGNVNFTTTAVTSAVAYQALQKQVSSGLFVMDINRSTGLVRVSASSVGQFDRGQFHGIQKAQPQGTTYSGGAMGGMAFGMLVLGVLLGLGVVYFMKKRGGAGGPSSFDNKNFDKS